MKKRTGFSKSCFCKTSDNWYPPCEGTTVHITVHISNKYKWISAWGDDDFGMSKSFDIKTPRHEVVQLYDKICSKPDVTISYLKELGFEQD